MDIEKLDVFPTLGLCLTIPKSVVSLSRALAWKPKKQVPVNTYLAYYDLSRFNRYQIGKYSSLHDAVLARNEYEAELVNSNTIKGILKEVAKIVQEKFQLI